MPHVIDRSSMQKLNKDIRALNDTLDQMDLIGIYGTFHSSAHGTFSKIDHILSHKSGLNQYQEIEIIAHIFSDHSALKLELNHKKKFGRNSNTWKLKTTLLKNVWNN